MAKYRKYSKVFKLQAAKSVTEHGLFLRPGSEAVNPVVYEEIYEMKQNQAA